MQHRMPPRVMVPGIAFLVMCFLLPFASLAQVVAPVVVGIEFPQDASLGGPSSGTIRAAERTNNLVLHDLVLPGVTTQTQKKAAAQQSEKRPRVLGGTLRYERVEFDSNLGSGLDGDIYSTNVRMRWEVGDFAYGIVAPYEFLDLERFNAHNLGFLLYGQYAYPVHALATLTFTLNGNYLHTFIDASDIDDLNTLGVGASTVLTVDTDRLMASVSLTYQFNDDDSKGGNDQQHQFKLGATAGMRLGERAAVQLFGIWNYDATDYNDTVGNIDEDYFDLGVDVTWNLTDNWSLQGGYKKVLGFRDVDSDMIFVGTLLRF